MTMAEPKDNATHVDLLEIDMTTGAHWLSPVQKNSGKPELEQIRKRNRDKWLAQNAPKAPSKD